MKLTVSGIEALHTHPDNVVTIHLEHKDKLRLVFKNENGVEHEIRVVHHDKAPDEVAVIVRQMDTGELVYIRAGQPMKTGIV